MSPLDYLECEVCGGRIDITQDTKGSKACKCYLNPFNTRSPAG